jgi:Cu-Zn family superoxide dismutase
MRINERRRTATMDRRSLIPMLALGLAGCATVIAPAGVGTSATADLKNAQGQSVGTATLTDVSGTVRVVVEMKGLPPGAKAVHVHAVGTCEGPQFTSAGGHFNPGSKEHGMLNPKGPHAGDLPNITIAADGSGRMESATDRISLGAGPATLFDADGSALVVHAAPDDFKTDPTGNAGGRLACGVIVKKP